MKVLLSKEELHDGVTRMADEIAACYQDQQLTIIGVLTGSVVLMADLIRMIDVPMRVGVLQASSYRGADDHARRSGDQFRSDARHSRPRRAVGRRHLRHRPHAQARDGQDAGFRPGVAAVGGAAAEEGAAGSRVRSRLRGVRHSGRVRRRLRARLRRHVSQSAVSGGARGGATLRGTSRRRVESQLL